MIEEQVGRRLLLARLLTASALATPLLALEAEEAEAANILFENTLFLSGATGATTKRTPAARWSDIFNVLDFGAKGDGSTDDTAAIQLAVTAAANNGIIFFPKGAAGTYHTTSGIIVPSGSSLIFTGAGSGAAISGNFNGFLFDNLSNPYNAANGISVIEQLTLQNGFTGNNFAVAAGGTWSASGSPVSITLSGSNPGVVAGGALWVADGRLSTNSVFIGMITSVASWPTVTVSSAAVGSGATANLGVRILQCYAASGSWSAGAATITMAATRPAGIGTGTYYVYDYEDYLADPRTDFPIGTATWSGTTLTFVPGYGGALTNSVGSSDRLWLAPAAGCVRYSSVVGATVRDCNISGFFGVTSSQDRIVPNDPSVGAAQGFELTIERCNFSNPSGFSGLMGQTGVILTNNSISYCNNFNSMWCGERLSGTDSQIIGGRAEVCYFGIVLGGDFTASNNSLAGGFISSRSMESNLQAIYCKGGSAVISSVGCSCNVLLSTVLGGFYFNAFSGVVENSGATGNFGSQYGIYVTDAGANRGQITFISSYATNHSTPSQSWRLPTQAWWGTTIGCDNPALVYLFAGLPTGSGSPTPLEGENYNLSDSATATWGANVTVGGSSNHVQVRWNGSNWTVVGK